MPTKSALLVVDMQRDFCPGGALPVPEGDQVVPRLNEYMQRFREQGLPVYASRDWHPRETIHFVAQGGPWPPHCVQGTPGAEFHPDLRLPAEAVVVSKGMDPNEDAYSAFQARDDAGRGLAEHLRDAGVERLYVGGLALDYCVKASALDAAQLGLDVVVLIDATRAVNVAAHDGEQAIEDLVRAGVELATMETAEPTNPEQAKERP